MGGKIVKTGDNRLETNHLYERFSTRLVGRCCVDAPTFPVPRRVQAPPAKKFIRYQAVPAGTKRYDPPHSALRIPRFEFPQVPLRGNTRQYADARPIPCRVLPPNSSRIAAYPIFLPHKITLLTVRKAGLAPFTVFARNTPFTKIIKRRHASIPVVTRRIRTLPPSLPPISPLLRYQRRRIIRVRRTSTRGP